MSLLPTRSLVSTNATVLPWNQYYLCNGSDLTAGDSLAIRNAGNKGMYGQKINQLYSVSTIVPDLQNNSIVTNDTAPAGSNTIDTSEDRSMTITQQVFLVQDTLNTTTTPELFANTFKQFETTFSYKAYLGSASSSGTMYIALKIIDPSTCGVPTLVPPDKLTLYPVNSTTAVNPIKTLTVSGSSITVDKSNCKATIFWLNSAGSTINTLTAAAATDPAEWVLLTIPYTGYTPATSPTPVTLNITLLTFLPLLSPVQDRAVLDL